MASTSEMLRAVHAANPGSKKKRFSDAELKKAYAGLSSGKAKGTVSAGQGASNTQGGEASSTDPFRKAVEGLYGPQGYEAGQALVDKYLQPGSLGRMETGPSAEQNEYTAKLKAGLGGYTSPEYQAQREQMTQGLNSNYKTAANQLAKAQARGKVYGAAGAAQQANLSTGLQNSKNDLEQKLMVQNIDEMQKRLGAYGGQVNALQGQKMDAEKTNLGQQAAETSGIINAFTGMGGQAYAQRQQEEMNRIMRNAIAAQNRG